MRENKVLGIIFSNMHDTILGELTENRTTGSVPFGGRYRMVDFVLSGMVNSDITEVGIITKQNYQSLMDHVGAGRAWDLARKRGGMVILPPFASRGGGGIYRGRLEAMGGAMSFIKRSNAKYVLLCDCDIIANIDVRDLIHEHIQSGAQITMMVKNAKMQPESLRDVTTVFYDSEHNVTDIMVRPDVQGNQNVYMNVMLIEKTLMERMVSEAISHDHYSLIRHALQPSIGKLNIKAYEFTGYSQRICGLKSYFDANMDLLNSEVRAQLFPRDFPIFTKVRDEVPVKYGLSSQVSNSLIADGCIIEGNVENSIIFRGVRIGKGAVIKNCIIMQNTMISDNTHLEYVITDKNVLIKKSGTLVGYETYPLFIAKGKTI